MAESRQRQKDRERLEQLRADTSEVWKSKRVAKVAEPNASPEVPRLETSTDGKRRLRKTGWWLALSSVKQFGFSPPDEGRYLLLPPEFDAILALETKAVAQI